MEKWLEENLKELSNEFVSRNFMGEFWIRRMELLMEKLGNPQEKYRVIHVAGTSGKGSTCFYISQILGACGKKVGTSLSPHVVDIRERFLVRMEFAEEEKLKEVYELVNNAKIALEREIQADDMNNGELKGLGKVSFFEFCVAMAYKLFEIEEVDFAVMETGLGGRLDGTNVVNRFIFSIVTDSAFGQNILGRSVF